MKYIIPSTMAAVMMMHSTIAQIKEITKPTDQYFEISKNLEIFSNIFKELNQHYVDPIEPGRMAKTGIDVMLYELDPYTNYYTETDKEDYEAHTTGKYGGIGVSLQIQDSNIYINALYENGPAHKANVKTGDELLMVNDIAVKGKSDDEMSLVLRGAPGTKVDLTLKSKKDGNTYTKSITREAIDVASVPLYTLVGKDKDIAYVYLTQFTDECSKDVKNALIDLKKQEPNLRGVILDLRNNPGGLLREAVNICNFFIPSGQLVVETKGRNTMYDKEYKTENQSWDAEIPLAILINNGSASASEIVSGTLQDLDRAVIIGTKSYGKGLVQNVKTLGYNTSLKLTTAKYYTPSGRCIQAIDYTHRNADGSVSSVPDSLKHSFRTRIGRTVYDGGGIDPDIVTKDTDISRTLIALMTQGQIFDFVTDYYYSHTTIAKPEEFRINDKEYTEFEKSIEDKKYSYTSESEEMVQELVKILENEKYAKETKELITQLIQKIQEGKKNNLTKSKAELKKLLALEIVGRYYYQKGRVLNRLYNGDEDLTKAIDILYNIDDGYAPILNGNKK